MFWRQLCRVQAGSAAGLLIFSVLGMAATSVAVAEPEEPVPSVSESSTATLSILKAKQAGEVAVELRGAGEERVKLTLTNTSNRRLNIVLPPGLVAASAAGQGGGRGFQSMGLGGVSTRSGGFGDFQSSGSDAVGFRSVSITDTGVRGGETVAVSAGQTVSVPLASVCLNYGVATPTARDRFELIDVDDYSDDPRVRKALRSLATYGTSHGVAQGVMWRVCNDVAFDAMAGKVINPRELALAGRFVSALESSSAGNLVDPAYLVENRLFVGVSAAGNLAGEAARLTRDLDGRKLLGLPVRSFDDSVDGTDLRFGDPSPSLSVLVTLSTGSGGETLARVNVNSTDGVGPWQPLGKVTFTEGGSPASLDGDSLVNALERSISQGFVTSKVVRRSSNSTTFKVENRLPFTLSGVTLKVGPSQGAPVLSFPGLGVAPGRSTLLPIQAPNASVARVELNGL